MSDKGGASPEIAMGKIIVTGRQERPSNLVTQTEKSVESFLSSGSKVKRILSGLEQGVKKVLKDEVRPLTASEAHVLLSSYGVRIEDPDKAYLIYQALRAKGEIATIPAEDVRKLLVRKNYEVSLLTDIAMSLNVPPDEFQRLLNLCLEN